MQKFEFPFKLICSNYCIHFKQNEMTIYVIVAILKYKKYFEKNFSV